MLRTRVIPCLLLSSSGMVKTTRFKEPKYVGDPINAVKIFNEKEADELVFLDITATVEGRRPDFDLLTRIASEAFMPFAYGGGLSTLEDIKAVLNLGVEKVVLNAAAAEKPDLISKAAEQFGAQSIVVSVDVKRNFFGRWDVYIRGGTRKVGEAPAEYASRMEKLGAGEIFLNSIDRDGTQTGYDLELIKSVSASVGIPVIACGGAGSLDDFSKAVESGADAVAAGSLFVFYGKHRAVLITYPSANELARSSLQVRP